MCVLLLDNGAQLPSPRRNGTQRQRAQTTRQGTHGTIRVSRTVRINVRNCAPVPSPLCVVCHAPFLAWDKRARWLLTHGASLSLCLCTSVSRISVSDPNTAVVADGGTTVAASGNVAPAVNVELTSCAHRAEAIKHSALTTFAYANVCVHVCSFCVCVQCRSALRARPRLWWSRPPVVTLALCSLGVLRIVRRGDCFCDTDVRGCKGQQTGFVKSMRR
jgi:hypothetical protein